MPNGFVRMSKTIVLFHGLAKISTEMILFHWFCPDGPQKTFTISEIQQSEITRARWPVFQNLKAYKKTQGLVKLSNEFLRLLKILNGLAMISKNKPCPLNGLVRIPVKWLSFHSLFLNLTCTFQCYHWNPLLSLLFYKTKMHPCFILLFMYMSV